VRHAGPIGQKTRFSAPQINFILSSNESRFHERINIYYTYNRE
jgi:hypothetical protein